MRIESRASSVNFWAVLYSKGIEEKGEELTVVFEIWILLLVPTVAPQLNCPFLANQHKDKQVPNVSKHWKGNQGNLI